MARKQHKYHFIYKTVNRVNGKWYMGMHSTSNLEDGYIGSGKRLWYSIRKYGRENFKMEIQEFLPDRRSLKEREKEIVNEGLLQDPMCMNLKLGGEGGLPNFSENEEHVFHSMGGKLGGKTLEINRFLSREKRIENIKQTKIEKYGSSNAWKGRKHTNETLDKLRMRKGHQVGIKNSQFGLKWIYNLELKQNKRIKKEEEIPDGWKSGRKIKF